MPFIRRDELKRAGGLMANVCFNLKQRNDVPSHIRATLHEVQTEWDAARDSTRAAPKSKASARMAEMRVKIDADLDSLLHKCAARKRAA